MPDGVLWPDKDRGGGSGSEGMSDGKRSVREIEERRREETPKSRRGGKREDERVERGKKGEQV